MDTSSGSSSRQIFLGSSEGRRAQVAQVSHMDGAEDNVDTVLLSLNVRSMLDPSAYLLSRQL